MALLEIANLSKTFGAHTALHQFDMSIEKGEFITFLGPSGCGKTTVLRMIAGFETPTRGTIKLGGRDVTYLRTRQRKVGMVFQSYALFPNMTVADNIGFGLKVLRRPRAEIKSRVEEIMVPSNVAPWDEVRTRLNNLLRGWATYFSYGTRLMAYRAADHHVYETVRGFLTRRHKVPSRGTRQFSDPVVFGKLGVLRLRRMHIGAPPTGAR